MTDLPPPPAISRGSRKAITVVFADLVGSTELGGEGDPETVRQNVLLEERVENRLASLARTPK